MISTGLSRTSCCFETPTYKQQVSFCAWTSVCSLLYRPVCLLGLSLPILEALLLPKVSLWTILGVLLLLVHILELLEVILGLFSWLPLACFELHLRSPASMFIRQGQFRHHFRILLHHLWFKYIPQMQTSKPKASQVQADNNS